ncbi:F-box/LRR-repeat protein-like protein [Salvia divinorum]|uniref:F-box/LRR-repeat protein-like protein n=1 Tax=Salvia divinorum TaxID=28513 RepID=A0ABD1FJW0_SALDI
MYVRWVDRLFARLQVAKPSTSLVEFRLSFHLSSSFALWINDWVRYALLRKLSLHCVDVSGEAVAFVLGNCRLLEQLSLHQAGMVLSLEVVGTSPAFKCLEISECGSLVSVVVRGSELVCIKYKGVGNSRNQRCRFVLVGVPLLTQLWIQAEARLLDFLLDMFDSLNFALKMIPNLKEFVVVLLGSDCCDKCSLMPWLSVVSTPCLQRFVFEASHQDMIKTYCNCSTFQLPIFTRHGDRGGVFLSRGRDHIHNSYSQIKEVEFFGYRGVSNQFQMVKEFLKYGTALDKIIVDPRSFEHKGHMPWDRIYRNHFEDEVFARNRARDQFKDSRINVTILHHSLD